MEENKNNLQQETNESQESSSDIKTTVIKCISLVCCVALVAVTLGKCLGVFSDTNLSIAESYSKNAQSALPAQGDNTGDNASGSEAPADSGEEQPSQPGDSSDAADSTGGTQQTGSASGTAANTNKGNAGGANKAPASKQEILDYFNKSINDVKPSAKSVTQTLEKNYQAASVELGSLGAFKGTVNKLIESNMGVNKEKSGVTATSRADKNKIFPVENESWSSKLTTADIKDAKISEKNGVYTVTIKILDDALTGNTVHGSGHHAKAVSIVSVQSIYDNAGAFKKMLGDVSIGFSNGTIVADIDAKTGHVTHAKYDFVWKLHVSSFGGITAPFGIIQEFDIKW